MGESVRKAKAHNDLRLVNKRVTFKYVQNKRIRNSATQ